MAKKQTVLIVDDDKVDREILFSILDPDYNVLEAENGEEALKIIADNEALIKCVISDIYMPEVNGFDFLELFKERGYKIPVIIATSDTDEETQLKVLDAGAWDFVTKPFNPTIISIRVKNSITRTEFFAFKKLKYISEFDTLTGIYNKDKFLKTTRVMLLNNPDKKFVFVRFDIDRFQLINSFYGTAEGDRFIKYIAMGLENLSKIRDNFSYGRLEADVFACCGAYESEEEILNIIEYNSAIIKNYNQNFDIVPTFGIYFLDDLTISPQIMLDRATLAAKTCKGNYMDTCGIFKNEMSENLEKEQEIINDMVHALEDNQFIIYLQPKYSLDTNSPAGAEALVRWVHPEKGMISPGLFIPIFEKNGFIEKLDHYVWEELCKNLRKWINAGINPHPISVNISRVDLYNPHIVDFIINLVDKYNLPHNLLQIELTETAYMDNPQVMKQVVAELKKNGFTILMDDFGSGYSSLSILKEVEVDILKIDMRFFDNTGDYGRGENIIASVVRMSKWLGMPTVAEGVEQAEQVNFLASVGCEYVQGFYFAKPMPVSEYEKLIIQSQQQLITKNVDLSAGLTLDKLWNAAPEIKVIYDNSTQASAICEYDGGKFTYLHSNRAYENLFGSDVVSEGNPLDFIFYEYKNDVLDAFSHCLQYDEITECQYQRRVVHHGKALWTSMTLQHVGELVDNKSIFIATFTDISDQKDTESELKKLKKLTGHKVTPKKLLVIDDSELSTRIIKDIFDSSFEVLTAKNGLEGLNLLKELKSDVAIVLLDMIMPIMNGRDFLLAKNENEDTVDIPVIVISSESDEGVQLDMLQMGVNDYITKPFVAEVIERTVKNVIDYNERFRKMVKEYKSVGKENA